MTRGFRFSIRLAGMFLLVACGVLAFAAPRQLRTVTRLSRPDEPVRIVSVKLHGKPVEFGKPFVANNDWPGGLSFVVKNTSAKLVSWVRVAITFRLKDDGPRMNDFVTYGIGHWDEDKLRGGGPPLKPGETAEIFYRMAQYKSTRELLDGMRYPRPTTRLEVAADQVIFADQPDLMWIEGKMNVFRSPIGWTPVNP